MMKTTYTKGQNLILTFKDRMEDPTDWQARVQVDVEEVNAAEIEGYFANSFLLNVEVSNEDYSEFPLSQTRKIPGTH